MARWTWVVLLAGCAGEAVDGAWDDADPLPDDAIGPPAVDLYVDRAVLGEVTTVTVDDVGPGLPVELVVSPMAGRGPCLPAYGGLCLGVVRPQRAGSAVTDRSGHAELQVNVPARLPASELSFQVVVGAGRQAVASPVQTRTVQPDLPAPLWTRPQVPGGFVSFAPQAIEVEGDTIWVSVGYSGGCAQHDFVLQWDGQFSLSIPPAVELSLWHDGHGDMCQAFIMERRRFDLSDIRAAYGGAQPEGLLVNVGRQQEA
ncbi:MAG TPA: hypothetical protein PKA64_26885, partial [Myxococcota bacterium]|nr:hypothetical protein [Myxococcota bacterium]